MVHFKVLNQPKIGMTNSHKNTQTVCFHVTIQKVFGYPMLKLTLTCHISYKTVLNNLADNQPIDNHVFLYGLPVLEMCNEIVL